METRIVQILSKFNIESDFDVLNNFPRKYYDCTSETDLFSASDGDMVCFRAHVLKIKKADKNHVPMLKIQVLYKEKTKVYITFFGQLQLFHSIYECVDEEAIIYGKLTIFKGYLCLTNPPVFRRNQEGCRLVFPVYTKYRGLSEDMYARILAHAAYDYPMNDYASIDVFNKLGLCDINTAYRKIHYPFSMADVCKGYERINFDKMLYYAIKLCKKSEQKKGVVTKASYRMDKVLSSFPYVLTKTQNECIFSIKEMMQNGEFVDALVQGDVGSGKSIIAFALLTLVAENGYQAVMIAPSNILAMQHFTELSSLLENTGLSAVYLGQSPKKKEKEEVYKRIKEGSANIIIGTHAAFSDAISYNNLGLVITDEEHKFGVGQKKLLEMPSVHRISMSATPIPRSITELVFDENKKVFNIEKPSSRKDVKTRIFSDSEKVHAAVKKELEKGRQVYIVCPCIDPTDEDSSMSDVASVEEVVSEYKTFLPDRTIGSVFGSMRKAEADKIISAFSAGMIDILVATTVVEVGVNIPNATLIVITNAERFGLATLHQLRGRVRRGEYDSYCILQTQDRENKRLTYMEETCDGFKIAERDMELRGTGNILGVEQAGFNETIELIKDNFETYKEIKKIAKSFIGAQMDQDVVAFMEQERPKWTEDEIFNNIIYKPQEEVIENG